MNAKYFISSLDISVMKIKTAVDGVTDEQARWKPQPEKWSILEVINHLYDEERYDFRMRLDLILNHPGKEWPGNDPEGWVKDRQYNKRDFSESWENFFKERTKSLRWLNALSQPVWDQTYEHPVFGALSAGDLLAAWAAHDYLHLKQLAGLQAQYLDKLAQPFSIRYASP
jgi:hypothetical protein